MHCRKEFVWLYLFLLPLLGIYALWGSLHKFQGDRSVSTQSTPLQGETMESGAVDILLSQSIFPTGTLRPGQGVLINLTFTNTGSTTMNSATVEDILPAALISATALSSGISLVDVSNGAPYRWQTGSLGAGARASIFIEGRIDPTLTSNATITNTAVITSAADTDPSNNRTQVALDVQAPRVGFNTTRYAVNESNIPFPIEVRVTNPNPYANIVVHYKTVDGSAHSEPPEQRDFTPISSTLVISPGYPSRQILIPILDDAISEGQEQLHVMLSQASGAALGATQQVTLTIIDDDSAGVNISPSAIEVEEAGTTGVYSVVLQSQPVADVTIDIFPDSAVTTSHSALHFNALNWQTVQSVTVAAVNDRIAEGIQESIIRHTVQSTDDSYNDTSVADVVATVRDDDAAGLAIAPGEVDVFEEAAVPGAVAAYSLVLKSRPTADVLVQMEPGNQLTTQPLELAFSPLNWSSPQTVTVAAVDDRVAEGMQLEHVAHAIISQDPHYADAATPDLLVHVADNDTPGVIISNEQITITENADLLRATEYYSVTLASQPVEPVSVTIQAAPTFSVTPTILRFDVDTWFTPQPVAISVKDDNIVREGQSGVVVHSVFSNDSGYAALAPLTLFVGVIDNDIPGLSYTPAQTNTLSEGGPPLRYELALESEPTANVTVTATVSGTQLSITPSLYIFTRETWNVPQAGLVSAADDAVDEGAHTEQINFVMNSADLHYNGLQRELKLTIIEEEGARTLFLPLVRNQP